MPRFVVFAIFIFTLAVSIETASAGAARTHIVEMKYTEEDGALYFEPARVDIRSGDTVVWVQADEINEHNVVAYPDGIPRGTPLFEGPLLDEVGQKYSVTFTKPGTYGYHCHPHEALGMKGVVIVDRESRPEEFRKASPSEMHHHQEESTEDGHATHNAGEQAPPSTGHSDRHDQPHDH